MARVGQALYRLQLLDIDLSEQLSKLREAQGLVGESQELLSARRAHEEATTRLATCETRLRELEMDLEAINSRISATEQRLYSGRVTNPKELAGLQQDHDHSKRSREKLEDEVLLALECIDEYEQAVAEGSVRLERVETKWRDEQVRLAKQIEHLQARVPVLKKDRAEVASHVEASHLALYQELLSKKGGRAVALLVAEMCQGCRVTVPSSTAQRVRRGQELVTCTTCGRVLTTEQ
jgi:predicted  nucleic acid-binding Zn-ribbon protein